jgi:hypothetical protein
VKERLITLGLALASIALFLAMFLQGDDGAHARGDIARPTSQERRANGYNAAMLWLEGQHVRTVSVRERFNKLDVRPALPRSGNLLIVTIPSVTAFKTEELRPLESWVREGNTLLVLAALSDNPDWAFMLGHSVTGELSLLTGLEFEPVGAKGKDEVSARIAATAGVYAQPRQTAVVPNGSAAFFPGVGSVVALSDYPSQPWRVKIPYDGFVLALAHEQQAGEAVLWTRLLGRGRVIVSGLGSLLTNRALGRADNGRLLANIVGATVAPGGAVLFDDMHQGLGASYDPGKFYSDPRLYETVGILVAVWLCWVLGSTRLRWSVTRAPVPREAELVQVTGRFFERVLTSDAAARGLFAHFFRRVSRERLEGLDGISHAEVMQLKQWHAAAHAARSVPLGRLHSLMVRIQRQLGA